MNGVIDYSMWRKVKVDYPSSEWYMIIKEEKKLRNFQECHSSKFPGHAGRDNKRQKEYKPNH